MADSSDPYYSEISEWWDRDGTYHPGHPDEDQLLNDAVQVTGHVWDNDGNDFYFTAFSNDGWEYDEWQVDVEDAYEHYV